MIKTHTRSEWNALIEEWERGTETQAAFCRRRGVEYATFRNRRYEFMQKSRREPKLPVMLPVQIVETQAPSSDPTPDLFLQFPNGACLRFVTGTSAAYVSSLVEAIVVRHAC
jgi:hypothetical protein